MHLQRLLQFFIRNRVVTSLLLTVSASLWLISSSPRQQLRSARFLTMYVFFPIQWTVDAVMGIRGTFTENAKLRLRVAELNTALGHVQESASEYERLRGMVGFTERSSHELLPVRVVAREPSHRFRSIVISAGSVDSVTQHMPVVDTRGLVGKVLQVMPHLSLVQLIRDPGNRTGVLVRGTRVAGILESRDGASMFMRVPVHIRVEPGDTVVTSGLGGIYPKGLLVGTVSRTEESSNPLFNRVYIDPFSRFGTLEEAFVMRLSPQWSSFTSELDSLEFAE